MMPVFRGNPTLVFSHDLRWKCWRLQSITSHILVRGLFVDASFEFQRYALNRVSDLGADRAYSRDQHAQVDTSRLPTLSKCGR
jgi:hypothetical protein